MLARILNNWPYKLAAILIAVALHKYVNGLMNPNTTRILPGVPVAARNLPAGYVITDMPQNVTIELSGPANILNSLRQDDGRIIATVNLSGAREGMNPSRSVSVALTGDLAEDVTVDSTSPPTVTVTVDRLQKAAMRVRVSTANIAPTGYSYQTPIVEPAVATVSGPASQLNMVREVVAYADVASDSHAAQPVQGMFDVIPLDSRGAQVQNVSVDPAMVHVIVPITRASAEKTLVVSPTVVGSPVYPWTITSVAAQPSMVAVTGPAPVLAGTGTAGTAPVDVAGAVGTIRREVDLRLPAGLAVEHPSKILVTIRLAKQRPIVPAAPATGVTVAP